MEVASSAVEFLGSKVEITMKKAEAVSWRKLLWDGPSDVDATKSASADKEKLSEELDNVNLDDVEVLVNHEAVEDAKRRFNMDGDHSGHSN